MGINFDNCIPEKRKYYGSRMVIVRVRRDFLVFNLQATFLLGFLLNFASGLLWQKSDHPIVLVGQESGSGESKMSKILTIACVQAVVQVSFRFILYLVHELVGMTSRHPIFFVGLGSKSSE